MIMQANALKECQNDQDKISGCVEKGYDANGNLRAETPYQNGKRHGIEKFYYENGKLRAELPYQSGKAQDISKTYYESGNLESELPYQNDTVHGIAKAYDENGDLMLEIVYKDGAAISGKCANGKKLTSADLHNFTNGDGVSCN